MPNSLEKFLATIDSLNLTHHLSNLNRGLEKESLRIDNNGIIAQTPHPTVLGSALTHPLITTDYSEALLEFITPVHQSIKNLLKDLTYLHQFTYQNIGHECLWVNSMPCILNGDESIVIARYGSSNVAQMKEAYRRGLSYRYGSLMQSIAGIHLNFSMPSNFWLDYLQHENKADIKATKSKYYFNLIRNFRRNIWLPCYLFGASPAVCKTFLEGCAHNLTCLDGSSFYAPYATSLRLSDLGYSNQAQTCININYNSLDHFVASIKTAIQTPFTKYDSIGVKVDGIYRQLSANLLQIENEHYSTIRPKRVAASGESPSHALLERGVEYVEVRCLDLNPFCPIGIDADCIRFFDIFLLYCMFSPSPHISDRDNLQFRENLQRIVIEGRKPALKLVEDKTEKPFNQLANTLMGQLKPIAELLDQAHQNDQYSHSLELQINKLKDSSLTPSAQILAEMKEYNYSFFEFTMDKVIAHQKTFHQKPLDAVKHAYFTKISKQSTDKQKQIEDSDTCDFDTFLTNYFKQNNLPLKPR